MYTVSTNSSAARGRGRPRDTDLRRKILTTAAGLAASEGTDIGFDRIAQAAGVSRTTLYRWWPSPQELLLDALLDSVSFSLDTDGAGPALAQLRRQVEFAAGVLSAPPTGAPLRALAAGALTRESLHRAFLERWLTPRRDAARVLIARGIADGTIVDEDPETLIDVLFAPVYHRAFFTAQPIDSDLIDALMRRVAASPSRPNDEENRT